VQLTILVESVVAAKWWSKLSRSKDIAASRVMEVPQWICCESAYYELVPAGSVYGIHYCCVVLQVRFHQEVLRLEPLAGKQAGGDSTRNWSVQPASEVSEADLEAVALPS
jgi:hypothetical protein